MIFGDPRSTAVFKTRLSLRGIPFPFLPPSFRHLETEPDDRHTLPGDQALRQQSSRCKASCPEVVSPGVEPRESRPDRSDQSAGSFWLLWITLSCPKVPWLFKRRFQREWKAVFFFFACALPLRMSEMGNGGGGGAPAEHTKKCYLTIWFVFTGFV